jgi:hypothetical protein
MIALVTTVDQSRRLAEALIDLVACAVLPWLSTSRL